MNMVPAENTRFFRCEVCECGGGHLHHTFFMRLALPFRLANEVIVFENHPVWVCSECKRCYARFGGLDYDVGGMVNLDSWHFLDNGRGNC